MISYSFSHVFKACTSLLVDVLRWLLEFLCQKLTFLSLWCWYLLIFFSLSLRFFCFFIYLVIFCWELEDLYFILWDEVFKSILAGFLWHLSGSGMGKVTLQRGSAFYLLLGLNILDLYSAFSDIIYWEYGIALLHPGSIEITVYSMVSG